MGIPYYFYNIYKKYENDKLLIDESDIKNMNDIEYLFFDYNSLIHPCAQNSLKTLIDTDVQKIEDKIIDETIIYTQYIMSIVKSTYVYIMIDGVAPMGKIIQQRDRRYKSYFFNGNKENNGNSWDSNRISPGTKFMDKLNKRLVELQKNYKNLYISDSSEIGEGEHKITKVLCENKLDNVNSKIVIYGLDGDLIMLSLLNKYSENIILLRDNSFNERLKECDKKFTYLDIRKLKSCIYKEICQKVEFIINIDRIIDDYILIFFLLGNDFIEHIPNLTIKDNGINVVMKSYIKTINNYKNYIIDKTKIESDINNLINIEMLKYLIKELSNSEDFYYKKIYKPEDYSDIDICNNDNIYYFRENPIDFSTSPKHYKKKYYILYNDSFSKTSIDKYCKDWLITIYWIYSYYNNHAHNNWTWYYKYHKAPFITDIYNYIVENPKYNLEINKVITKTNPLSIREQLFYILPKQSLLNEITDETIIRANRNKFPNKIYIDLINKKWLWESKIFFKEF